LKLSDIGLVLLNISFTVPHRTTLFGRVHSYWLILAQKHYSSARSILLIILRGHMLRFGNQVALR